MILRNFSSFYRLKRLDLPASRVHYAPLAEFNELHKECAMKSSGQRRNTARRKAARKAKLRKARLRNARALHKKTNGRLSST